MAALLELLIFICTCMLISFAVGEEYQSSEDPRSHPARPLSDSNDTIYVHVVPHTHDDVGWQMTVDEYYYESVQYILDTIIEQLLVDKDRTFIYIEMAFFTRWWNEQSNATKDIVKRLVKNKQLEFVNAGWCMNDEAATHYNAIIDQMTLGLKFVENTFGADARPRVAWQIDPFGHSNEMAAIFATMGFDGLFFSRLDYDDKNKRLNDKTMEMVWRPSRSLGQATDLFTGILIRGYSSPPGFCFDQRCIVLPMQDDRNLFDYNVNERVDDFIKYILQVVESYRTGHIMFTFGGDFQYKNAIEDFKNLDKLMKYTMEKEPRIKVFYSTPSRYLDALNQAGLSWSVKEDDFFPYANKPYAYWTGYFTSRPALKAYVREMNSMIQVCKQLEVLGTPLMSQRKTTATSKRLQEAMGVSQHHDAVSGTEKQYVAYDYATRLHIGQVECEALVADVAGAHMSNKSGAPAPKFKSCEYLNISICPTTELGNFNVLVYNPIARSRPVFLRLPVNSTQLSVMDDSGESIVAQVVKVSNATVHARSSIPGSTKYELIIEDMLLAFGFKTYFVRSSSAKKTAIKGAKVTTLSPMKTFPKHVAEDIPIENDHIQVLFDGLTKRIKRITNKDSEISVSVDQSFYWYNSSDGHNKNSTQASGAYIFRPNGTQPFDVSPRGIIEDFSITQGELFIEATQKFNSWVYQSVRIFYNQPFVEFEFTVGPIPVNDSLGKEIITRFSTDLDTNRIWYTDANGREMQKRVRNFRPTWKLNNTDPVAENYYPVNSRIYMKDTSKDVQFTVLTDCSQGGSSLNDGQLELMVHRRMLHDDHRGVGEPLNEPGVDGKGLIIRGRHLVLVDNVVNSTIYHRMLGELLMMRPYPLFVSDSGDPKDFMKQYKTNFTSLTKELPPNVHLLTLQSLGDDSYLLRLEHQYAIDEPPFNKPLELSLSDLFIYEITSVKELALGGNTEYPVNRLKWKTNKPPANVSPGSTRPIEGPKFTVTLNPMEIRTFEVNFKF